MEQIIAMGGGGFAMEPDNPLLDQYILRQARTNRPSVCFLAQAGGENLDYIVRFYQAFTALECRPTHLSLFTPHTADIAGFLAEQDVIYVGGGNSKSMLALWREWGMDDSLRAALAGGTVLAGVSAGALCWFEYGTTDSIPGALTPIRGLGYLAGACSPHYDGEAQRRPRTHALVQAGDIPACYGIEDSCAAHFIDGALHAVVSSRDGAQGYRVTRGEGAAVETALGARYLG